jgi:hypothetical protein
MFRISFIFIFFLLSCQSTQVVDLNSVSLDTSGPVAINVQSFGGTVTIVADPEIDGTFISANQYEVGLGAVPIARLYMDVSTYIEHGPLGETVYVIAKCENDPLHTVTANIVVRAQDIHGVSVVNERGDVIVKGITGPVNIQTRDGDVRIVTPLVMNEQVTVENRRGNIVYRVRSESSGLIDATAINGEATLDVRYGNAVILPGSTGVHLAARFNDGVNPITMRTVEGNIRIFVVPDPIGSEPLFDTDWISW